MEAKGTPPTTPPMHRSATLVQRRSLASLPLTWLPQTKKVGIVGGGPLGEALAFQCALAGFDTSVMDLSMIALERMADAHRALSDQFTTDMSQGTPSVPAWGPLCRYGQMPVPAPIPCPRTTPTARRFDICQRNTRDKASRTP